MIRQWHRTHVYRLQGGCSNPGILKLGDEGPRCHGPPFGASCKKFVKTSALKKLMSAKKQGLRVSRGVWMFVGIVKRGAPCKVLESLLYPPSSVLINFICFLGSRVWGFDK